MDGDRARPDLSSLAKVSMQTDLAENLQEFNSIETERNAIYLLTWLANKPLQGGGWRSTGGTGRAGLPSGKKWNNKKRPSGGHRLDGWQLVCPETEEAIEVASPYPPPG